ncbi:MAG TPA: hypothetical protein VGF28_08800, partial [Thermoanaerobaculia bacterium]
MKFRLSVLLLICAAAAAAGADQHPHVAKGFDPNRVYHFNDLDAINAFNGNLTVTIPVGQEYSIGGGLSYQLRLSGNGMVWDSEERVDLGNAGISCGKTGNDSCVSAFPNRRSNAGLGWTISLGRLFPPREQTNASGVWEYESPDGGVHSFYEKFNNTYTDGARYTSDGSYLRMKQNGTQYLIEFPTGEVHTFVPDDDPSTTEDDENDDLAPWLLKHIGNKFNPTALTVTCTRSGGVITAWTITDGSRSHTVTLGRMPFESGLDDVPPAEPNWGTAQERMLVQSITVAAFQGTSAQYTFNYTAAILERPGWDTISGSYHEPLAPVQLLSSLGLPDGTSYAFEYNRTGLGGVAGCLKEMILPTRGKIAWEWEIYKFPERGSSSEDPYAQNPQPGVKKRHVYAPDGTLTGSWTYVSEIQPPIPNQVAAWTKTTITDPAGGKTENFFDTSSGTAEHATYGLPYNPLLEDVLNSKRYVSQRFTPPETIAPATQPVVIRETSVRYEFDPANTTGGPRQRNARVASSRTRYNAGNPTITSDDEIVDVDKDGFDGYGHYRIVKETVDSGLSTQQTRTTTTNYNPGRGRFPSTTAEPFVPIQPAEPWITGTYDSLTKTDSSGTEKATYCFDAATGVLLKKRVPRGTQKTQDLVTVFAYNAGTGNLEREQYFGGDITPVPEALDSSCAPQTTAPFEIVHTYAAGSRATSKYTGVNFRSLDLTIDTNTGLPRSSKDSAGVVTTFVYDASSRLTEVRPAGSAWTQYEYLPASGTTVPASVSATQWPELASAAAGEELTHVKYHYDGLGRLVQESRRMPDGWAVSSTRYDALNRKTAAYPSTYQNSSAYVATPSGQSGKWTYDGQGRVVTVVQPDGSRTEVEYKTGTKLSGRGKRTTSKVATGPLTSTNPQTDVTVEEKSDGFGRLVQVTENAGATGVVTNYAYDVQDRLLTVTMGEQTRQFDYDGAGLLTSETHPETDAATTFKYDARGHVTTRTTPTGAVVSFDYDKAERLITVSDAGGKLKQFFFDRSATDGSMGKLDRAIRYNRHPNLAGGLAKVEEKFHYEGPGGRVSRKVTTVAIGPEAAPAEKYEFAESYEYEALGETWKITYPGCTSGCGSFSPPLRTVTTERHLGMPSAVTPYVSGVEYAPGGALTEIRHVKSDSTTGPIYRQDVDATGRPQKIEVSKFCEDLSSVTLSSAPTNTENLAAETPVTLTATALNVRGEAASVTSWSWYTRGVTGDVPLPYTTSSIPVEAGEATSYFAKAKNDTCSADSPVKTVTSCGAVAPTISGPEFVTASVQERAFVSETPGATYKWSITNGQLVGTTTASSVAFIAACSGVVELGVEVTTSCSTSTPPKEKWTIRPAVALVGGTKTIDQPGTHDITVELQGQGPWTVVWQDAGQVTYNSSPAVRQVDVSATTSYTVLSATDARGCPLVIAVPTATITLNAQCTAPTPTLSTTLTSALASKPVTTRPVGEWTTYHWTLTNARIDTSTQNAEVVRFIPGCSGSVGIELTVTNACGASGKVSRSVPIDRPSVAIAAASSTLTYVPGEAPAEIEYDYAASIPQFTWSDGTTNSLRVSTSSGHSSRFVTPSSTTTYRITALRDAYGCTGTVAGQSVVKVCPRPAAVIAAPSRVVANTNSSASVSETGGATYQWSLSGGTGTIVGPNNMPTVVFRAACGLPVKLTVKVTASCLIEKTSTVEIPVDPPTATLTGSTTITQGSSTTLTVSLSGIGPWVVSWADLGNVSVNALPYTRTVKPESTTTYTLTGMTTGGCTGTVAGQAMVTVVIPPPGGVIAEATSANAVRIQWSDFAKADGFDVYRNGRLVGSVPASPFNDINLPAGTAYLYRVVAKKGLSFSQPSATDLATAIGFTRNVSPGSV